MVSIQWVLRTEDLISCETAAPAMRRAARHYRERLRIITYLIDKGYGAGQIVPAQGAADLILCKRGRLRLITSVLRLCRRSRRGGAVCHAFSRASTADPR